MFLPPKPERFCGDSLTEQIGERLSAVLLRPIECYVTNRTCLKERVHYALHV